MKSVERIGQIDVGMSLRWPQQAFQTLCIGIDSKYQRMPPVHTCRDPAGTGAAFLEEYTHARLAGHHQSLLCEMHCQVHGGIGWQ